MKKRVAIYARVSMKDQNEEPQVETLKNYCKQKGWHVVATFQDRDHGDKSERADYKKMLDFAYKGKCDVVIVWKFDRFARSSRELVTHLEEFHARGVDFVSFTENIDTTTPMGKAVFTIISAISELELENIRKRIRHGIDHAKKHGTKSGKRIGMPLTPRDNIRNVIRLHLEGNHQPKNIQRRAEVSKGTYYKIVNTVDALKTGTMSQEDIINDYHLSADLFDRVKAVLDNLKLSGETT